MDTSVMSRSVTAWLFCPRQEPIYLRLRSSRKPICPGLQANVPQLPQFRPPPFERRLAEYS